MSVRKTGLEQISNCCANLLFSPDCGWPLDTPTHMTVAKTVFFGVQVLISGVFFQSVGLMTSEHMTLLTLFPL